MRGHRGLKRKLSADVVVTPERIQQIKGLLARGETGERIAAIIWSRRGHTESDMLEAGDQLTTTES
jgi:hypothetical protein